MSQNSPEEKFLLINTLNKTFFDLGPGKWNKIHKDRLYDIKKIYLSILIILDGFLGSECTYEILEQKSKSLSLQIIKFLQGTIPEDIEVITKTSEDESIIFSLQYSCVGTCKYDPGTFEWQREIDINNDHLSENWSYFFLKHKGSPRFKKF